MTHFTWFCIPQGDSLQVLCNFVNFGVSDSPEPQIELACTERATRIQTACARADVYADQGGHSDYQAVEDGGKRES